MAFNLTVFEAEREVDRLARVLSGMDPMKSPTRYQGLLTQLDEAKAALANSVETAKAREEKKEG